MNTNTTKLFDANNNLIDTFEIEVENVLKSIYGENYYDTDEDYIKEEVKPQKIEKDNKTYYNDSHGNLVYPIRFGSIIL